MKHTQGSAEISPRYSPNQFDYRELLIGGKLRARIFNENFSMGIDKEQAEANAERIKVLWNAMDGLSNEQVEALIPAIQKAEQGVLDMAHERDMDQFGTWASIFNELRLITRSKK